MSATTDTVAGIRACVTLNQANYFLVLFVHSKLTGLYCLVEVSYKQCRGQPRRPTLSTVERYDDEFMTSTVILDTNRSN
jgi:hypothetical protein